MKLKDYIKELNKIVKSNPAAKEYEVVYSCDDEGNAFCPVNFTPSTGEYMPDSNLFEATRTIEDHNAICLN
jgi:hypothetical protein